MEHNLNLPPDSTLPDDTAWWPDPILIFGRVAIRNATCPRCHQRAMTFDGCRACGATVKAFDNHNH